MARTDAAWPGQSDQSISFTLVQPTLLSQSIQQINRTSTAFFFYNIHFWAQTHFTAACLMPFRVICWTL